MIRLPATAEVRAEIARTSSLHRLATTLVEMAWWQVDAGGTVTVSDGPGLHRLGREPGQIVGRNLYRDWPSYAGREPVLSVRRVLAGEADDLECTYALRNPHTGDEELWWARVRSDYLLDRTPMERGAVIVTHPVSHVVIGACGVHDG